MRNIFVHVKDRFGPVAVRSMALGVGIMVGGAAVVGFASGTAPVAPSAVSSVVPVLGGSPAGNSSNGKAPAAKADHKSDKDKG
ncbi:MAG: hypothetical protein FWD11_08350, partial [Micrococcales bacterium]|nr:hypothetical protein [Micrococcales bacterium]